MTRIFAAAILVAVAAAPAYSQDRAASQLAKQLYAKDVREEIVPPGYKFEFIDPIARGAFEDQYKVKGRVAARFSRAALVRSNPDLAGSWEGFTYYIFGTPAAAAAFDLPASESAYVLQSWLSDGNARALFNVKTKPNTFPVQSKTAEDSTAGLRCLDWDFMIGCLFLDAKLPVAVHLTLIEPKLRSAASLVERRRIAEARVQSDGAKLLNAARVHLSQAMTGQAGPPPGQGPAAQCEVERQRFLATATSLAQEAKAIPRSASGNPETPAALAALCSNLQRGIVEYSKGSEHLERCGGTEQQKAVASRIVTSMKSDVERLGCERAK